MITLVLPLARVGMLPSLVRECVEDPALRTWLGGGAVRDVLWGRAVRDFDLFFGRPASLARAEEILRESRLRCTYRCPAGELTTWKGGDDVSVQLVSKAMYGGPEEMIDTFDITAGMFALNICGETVFVTTTRRAICDARQRRVGIHRVTYPASTMARIARYEAKGYSPGSARSDFVLAVSGRGWSTEELEYYPID